MNYDLFPFVYLILKWQSQRNLFHKKPRHLDDSSYSFAFHMGILAAFRLEHPHIVKMYECFEERQSLWVVCQPKCKVSGHQTPGRGRFLSPETVVNVDKYWELTIQNEDRLWCARKCNKTT